MLRLTEDLAARSTQLLGTPSGCIGACDVRAMGAQFGTPMWRFATRKWRPPPRRSVFLAKFRASFIGTMVAEVGGMLRPIDATELLLEVLRDEEDDDELLSVLMTCQRALRDFEFALQDLVELESDIPRANTTSEVEELDDRLSWIRMAVGGTALEGRLVRANSELERRRDRLT